MNIISSTAINVRIKIRWKLCPISTRHYLLLACDTRLEGASIAGLMFCAGRIFYAIGYYSGDPEKRVPGALISQALGLIPLLFMSVSFGAGLLGWW